MENEKVKSSPRDVFLYLLTIITLYVSVWRFIDLLFDYINFKLPDALYNGFYESTFETMRLSIASLIVVFPVYLGLTWFLRKDIIKNPEKREMKVRKWLLYFTLFLAAITIIVDLVTLINNFLTGELTLRFVLKVVVVLVVASAVFGYYIWDLKRETTASSKPSKLLAISASIVVLIGISASFFIIGSPSKQRNLRFDERRINDLSVLQSQIIDSWINKKSLPKKLEDLKSDITGFIPPVDPATEQQYEYEIVSSLKFKLCANFASPSPADRDAQGRLRYADPYSMGYPYGQNWDHEAGRACFERTIDPDLYRNNYIPPVPKF